VLGNGARDMQCQPGRMGIITRDEVGVGVHEIGDERHIAADPVKASDDESRTVPRHLGERRVQLGPISALAALDLCIVGDDLAAGAAHLSCNCLALRVKAKA